MSLIRCLSNPESLYVYGTGNGRLSMHVGSEDVRTIPWHVFSGVLRRWIETGQEEVKYRGAKIVEGFNKPAKETFNLKKFSKLAKTNKRKASAYWRDSKPAEYRVTLHYDGWKITAYEVTWIYMASQFKWYPKGRRP